MYTKHIYIGTQRIASKLADLERFGDDPRQVVYASAFCEDGVYTGSAALHLTVQHMRAWFSKSALISKHSNHFEDKTLQTYYLL